MLIASVSTFAEGALPARLSSSLTVSRICVARRLYSVTRWRSLQRLFLQISLSPRWCVQAMRCARALIAIRSRCSSTVGVRCSSESRLPPAVRAVMCFVFFIMSAGVRAARVLLSEESVTGPPAYGRRAPPGAHNHFDLVRSKVGLD